MNAITSRICWAGAVFALASAPKMISGGVRNECDTPAYT